MDYKKTPFSFSSLNVSGIRAHLTMTACRSLTGRVLFFLPSDTQNDIVAYNQERLWIDEIWSPKSPSPFILRSCKHEFRLDCWQRRKLQSEETPFTARWHRWGGAVESTAAPEFTRAGGRATFSLIDDSCSSAWSLSLAFSPVSRPRMLAGAFLFFWAC